MSDSVTVTVDPPEVPLSTPEIEFLTRLAETCALMRRGASLELAEVAIAEERRLRGRIERIRERLAVVTVVEPAEEVGR